MCYQTVWVGALAGVGNQPAYGGFRLNYRERYEVGLDDHWSGRFWGRTNCNFNGGRVGVLFM